MSSVKTLTGYKLKLIAILAMAAGHAAFLIPSGAAAFPLAAPVLDAVSRVTMPIMCFFISEGFFETRNLKKYFLRLLVFALISQVPFYLFRAAVMPEAAGLWNGLLYLNVLFTLASGLAALWAYHGKSLRPALKAAFITTFVLLTFHCDYAVFGALWILSFGIFRGDKNKQFAAFGAVTLVKSAYMLFFGAGAYAAVIQLFALAALPLLDMYGGKRGRNLKYLFYIFYPAHLLILALIKLLILS